MKNKFKHFVVGTVFGIIALISFQSIAASIDVLFNAININVNGSTATTKGQNYQLSNGQSVPYSILYKGTTYLPIRKVGELVGKEITWDAETETATIKDIKVTKPIEYSNISIKTELSYTKAYGEVKNIDSVKHDFSLKITYFDVNGAILGTGKSYISDLQPGESKTFEAIALNDYSNYKTYKIQLDNIY